MYATEGKWAAADRAGAYLLRIHGFLQHWFNLADLACEEALYDSASLRRFAGIDLGSEPVPDATTMLKFRRLLEQHQAGRAAVCRSRPRTAGQRHDAQDRHDCGCDDYCRAEFGGRRTLTGSVIPKCSQTRKGKQWYFGMKLHIGVDSQSGLAHSAVVTPANIHDKHPLPDLLHGQERRVYGDSAYTSQKALIRSKAPKAKDFTNERVRKAGQVDEAKRAKNRSKSKIRARVEARVCRGQAAVGLYESTLPRLGQECQPGIHGAGVGQYLLGAPSADGTRTPVMGETG